jgi:predicted dehydrogenase
MEAVRIGFIGASRGLQLARASQSIPELQISGFFDLDTRRAKQAVQEVGGRVFSSLDELLAFPLDALVVASPIPDHLVDVSMAASAGKHILCEVTPCSSIEESRQLVTNLANSDALFMLAENYCYFSEVETVRQLHQRGEFGEVYYAECDHLIDVKALWRDQDGALTWRGRGGVGVYSTHGIGPLLSMLDDRILTVSGDVVEGGKFDDEVRFPTMHLLQMTTVKGVKIRMRIDLASSRPPLGAYFGLQGTRGAYESWRGLGDRSKVWLEGRHGPSSIAKWGEWHALDDFRQQLLGDDWEPVPEISGADRRMMRDFVAAVRGDGPNPFDIHRALDFHLPGLMADLSAARGGSVVEVPDSRSWTP